MKRAALALFHARSWRMELGRRSLLWALLASVGLSWWTALCIIFTLPRNAYWTVFLFFASLLPVFLAWPIERKTFILPLRKIDRDNKIEAWMEAAEGPAKTLLEKSVGAELEALLAERPSRRPLLRGLKIPLLVALISLVLLEFLSQVLLARPILVYEGPPQEAGSGLRLAEAPGAPQRPTEGGAGLLPDSRLAAIEAGKNVDAGEQPVQDPEALAAAFKQARLEAANPTAASSGSAKGAPSGKTEGTEASQNPAEGGSASSPAKAERGQGNTTSGEGSGSGVTGFEGNGKSGVASPLVDYRSRVFKMLGDRGKGRQSASGDLSSAELRDFESRFFSSFQLTTGLKPREDAYTVFLKRRWAEADKQ